MARSLSATNLARAHVTIDGVAVPDGTQNKLSLSEGSHQVTVTGAVNERFELPMQTGFWGRWSNDPVWVVNVAGATPLALEKHHYAAAPPPTETTFHVGEHVFFAPHVDYVFTPAPNSLQVDDKSRKEVIKWELSIVQEKPVAVFEYARETLSIEDALSFAEGQLLVDPKNAELLTRYTTAVAGTPHAARASKYFEQHLTERPIVVNWHRHFQELHTSAAARERLTKQYDDLLRAEPNHASLLYLRGRIAPTLAESRGYFDRAIAADRSLSWTWAAVAYSCLAEGEWAECKRNLVQANRFNHEDDLSAYMHIARIGLGESIALESEYRQKIARSSPDETLQTVLLLTNVLIAKGDTAGANRVLDDWQARQTTNRTSFTNELDSFRGLFDLMAGNLAAVGRRVQQGSAEPSLKLHWLLASLRPAEVEHDNPALKPLLDEPWNAVAFSLSYDLAGNPAQAGQWRGKAATALAERRVDDARAADILRSAQPPTQAELTEVQILPNQKSAPRGIPGRTLSATARRVRRPRQRFAVLPDAYTPLIKISINRRP